MSHIEFQNAKDNTHSRDSNINFREDIHEYTIEGVFRKPISVTTLIHKYFPSFNENNVIKKMMSSPRWPQSKYYGMTTQEIKNLWSTTRIEASKSGTALHKQIEDFINNEPNDSPLSKEYGYFMDFWDSFMSIDLNVVPYRTEWVVYDEDAMISGSIDFVAVDKTDSQLILIDWKRSKEIKKTNAYEKGYTPFKSLEHCNYNHYTLQLNFYREILERKYNATVKLMMFVVFHPNNESYLWFKVNHVNLKNRWNALNKWR